MGRTTRRDDGKKQGVEPKFLIFPQISGHLEKSGIHSNEEEQHGRRKTETAV